MRSSRAIAALALFLAAAARGETLKVFSAALLYETGQVAPAVGLRSLAPNGAMWRAGITGWTFSLDHERPAERGRRVIFGISATPYNAHSSRRMYFDGVRERLLEFDDAAITARAGMQFPQGEHASIEPAFVVGKEWISLDQAVDWRRPYAGIAIRERIRFVTADDPLLARIEGVEVTATAEGYRGNRTWTRATIEERAGLARGRLHLRQSLAAFGGSGLDIVSAFLVGGSWDALGPFAVFGRRYAEFRVTRGVVANGGADVAVGRSFEIGVRGSVFRGASQQATGAMLLLTRRVNGVQIAAGVARSRRRTTVTMTVGGAVFHR
jgi:hypothetical protein